jgi:hypothetical protein
MWLKRGNIGMADSVFFSAGNGTAAEYFGFEADKIRFSGYTGATHSHLTTTRVFRDPSAWLHVVVAVDTTDSTSGDRLKMYINGVRETAFGTETYPAQNTDFTGMLASGEPQDVGRYAYGASAYYDGYIAEMHVIDGQALAPSSFGKFSVSTGEWVPINYSGTYGNNGWYLDFANSSDYGSDQSGNANDFTDSGLATNDQSLDTPTLNFPVMGSQIMCAEDGTLSNGNLDWTYASAGNAECGATFLLPATGKWAFEVSGLSSGANVCYVAFMPKGYNFEGTMSAITDGMVYESSAGVIELDNVDQTAGGYGSASGVLVRFEYNRDGNSLETFYDNVSKGTVTWDGNGEELLIVVARGGGTAAASFNFGQLGGGLTNTPTSGFLELNSNNIDAPSILDPSEYFNVLTFTGNSTNPRSLTGVGFQPDLVWLKNRDNANLHFVVDAVRGGTQILQTDNANIEAANETSEGGFNSIDSDGFTVDDNDSTGQDAGVNDSAYDYVAWNWLGDNSSGSSNSDGSITSTVNANQTSGFSIVTYTGTGANATVGHGLGAVPKFITVKCRSVGYNWLTYHGENTAAPETDYLVLDTNAATVDLNTVWNDTAPTSSVFSLGTDLTTNRSGETYVAYCWAEIAGFSQFGFYEGNGEADGMFVNCGFKPAFVMIKRTDAANDWFIADSTRSPGNSTEGTALFASTGAAEAAGNAIDLLSNGFKARSTGAANNANLGDYVYVAFAEVPFKYARAR